MELKNNNIYYVYGLIDPRTNNYFYIGKGKGNRAEQHFKETIIESQGNHGKINLIQEINNENLNIEIYYFIKDINEEAAYFLEEILIDRIGRKILNYGPLTNILVGGIKEDKLKFSLIENEKTTIEFTTSKYPFLNEVIESIPRTTKEDLIKADFNKIVKEVIAIVLSIDSKIFDDLEATDIKYLNNPYYKAIQFDTKIGKCELGINMDQIENLNWETTIYIRQNGKVVFKSDYGMLLIQGIESLRDYLKNV